MSISLSKGVDSVTFEARALPVHDPKKVNVVVDYSEGRQLYAYDKGVVERFFNLVVTLENQTAFDDFDDFFETVAVGPTNTVTYTDEDSNTYTVRIMNLENPLREVEVGKFSGTIKLREEI